MVVYEFSAHIPCVKKMQILNPHLNLEAQGSSYC